MAKQPEQQKSQPTQAEINLLSYQLWEQEGRLDGRDMEYWLKAEAQLQASPKLNEVKPATASPAAPTVPARPSTPVSNGNRNKTRSQTGAGSAKS